MSFFNSETFFNSRGNEDKIFEDINEIEKILQNT